jgi:hypothetical protein
MMAQPIENGGEAGGTAVGARKNRLAEVRELFCRL